MPAATPRLYFQTLFEHEVSWIMSTLNAGQGPRNGGGGGGTAPSHTLFEY